MMTAPALAIWLGAILVSGSAENTAFPAADRIEVRASALPERMFLFPVSSHELPRAELERLAGLRLPALLRTVAGTRVAARGGAEADRLPTVRGSSSEQVLVLLDGQRMNSARGGGVDLATVFPEDLESLQIVRGGGSALWGGGALGGAIHLNSREPRRGEGSLRVALGGEGHTSIAGRSSFGLPANGLARATALWNRGRGDYTYVDDQRATTRRVDNADYSRVATSLRAQTSTAARLPLRVDVAHAVGERGVPGSEEFPTPSARLREERSRATVRIPRNAGQSARPELRLSWSRLRNRYREPQAPFGAIHEEHTGLHGEAELAWSRHTAANRFEGAIGADTDHLRSTASGTHRRRATFLRLAAARSHGPLRALIAARLDALEGFSPRISPRVGMHGDFLGGQVHGRVTAGLSFRPPSFDDLFWPARANAAGNRSLRPESGRDVDAGLRWRPSRSDTRLELSAFLRRVDDLIQWMPGAGGVWRPHNVGAAQLRGLELEGVWDVALRGAHRGRLQGAVTRMESQDRSGDPGSHGHALLYRPPWTASARALWQAGEQMRWMADVTFVDRVFTTRANTKTLPAHTRIDMHFSRRLTRGGDLEISLLNLNNQTARDYRDYPLPGRTWRVGIRWQRRSS